MQAIPTHAEKPHCVVADDVRMLREQFGQWMEELGFSVTHATCGATALAAIRQSRPNVVVTDIEMPHFSGIHLLQTIRRDPDPCITNVPVIVSSSLQDPKINRILESLGRSVFLRKPASKAAFFQRVMAVLSGNSIASV